MPLLLAFCLGGCSFSYQLESLFEKKADPAEATGSVAPAAAKSEPALPPEADLVLARTAAAEVLSRGGSDISQAWENPRTGARGTVTPIATAYVHDGTTCRDFLASHVRAGAESWMQGEACQAAQGKWEVKTLRPWKRS